MVFAYTSFAPVFDVYTENYDNLRKVLLHFSRTDFSAHSAAIHEDYSFMKFENNFNYFS